MGRHRRQKRDSDSVEKIMMKGDDIAKRIRSFSKGNPERFEQLVKESTSQVAGQQQTKCQTKNKTKSKSKSLRTPKQPEFELQKGMSDYDGNVYAEAPGFAFLKSQYKFFVTGDLPFEIPTIPPKPMKSNATVDLVSTQIVGVVEGNCAPMLDDNTKQMAAGQFVRIRAKKTLDVFQFDYVLASTGEIVNRAFVSLAGCTEEDLAALAKKMYENYIIDRDNRQHDYDRRYCIWMKGLRDWEWSMFLLAQRFAGSVTWSPGAIKSQILAAVSKDEVLFPWNNESDPHPEVFYAATVDNAHLWVHHKRYENVD
ncbi:uncharacterized protein TRUGW13939_07206 [Talaromyces rugulosus]|uniref:Uncharacterized protein n=1 Tax=Talaromyces rugulosus TaxID=121627 RepID=A0A7H8R132_TALRU|nr:uncharacterized protein TRUGW13939_07206 [Talaromyces rugulosus]QKX60064.1 hypothetical protein TRUGW13939_07206 [Talaromyces rugulosus]